MFGFLLLWKLIIFARMNLLFLFIGGPEIFVIILIVVMLFGADKIPEIVRGLGKGMRQVKDATEEIKREINESAKKQGLDSEIVEDINTEINDVKGSIDDLTNSMKRKI